MRNINDLLEDIKEFNPTSVLDIYMGSGAEGALIRCLLDFNYGRVKPNSWNTIISGIVHKDEEKYENPLWDLYTNIEVVDDIDLNRCGGYDLVMVSSGVHNQETLEILDNINKRVIELAS